MERKKPYYAVIFTSKRTSEVEGYAQMADKMEALARRQPGFLDFESAREGLGISISYWDSPEAIAQWKNNAEHLLAQHNGKKMWYSWYRIRICRVEREYEFIKP